jgi:hypothetical protein
MNRVTVDESLRGKLNGLDEPLELCDETGQTVGHFLPPELYREMLLALARAAISDEELEERRREPGGRTLAEIWERLGRQPT